MTEPEVFLLADQALNGVVRQIRDDQWDVPVPPSFARRKVETNPTLREIIAYLAYEDAWVPDMLAGHTMEQVGKEKFKGDLLGDDPRGNFAAIGRTAMAAAARVEDLQRVVHTSFGDYKTREYFWQANQFRGLRAWDVARVIGVDPELPDALVEGLWEEVSPHAEEWRGYGVFPAAVPVPADAPLLDRLLGLTGRDPGTSG